VVNEERIQNTVDSQEEKRNQVEARGRRRHPESFISLCDSRVDWQGVSGNADPAKGSASWVALIRKSPGIEGVFVKV